MIWRAISDARWRRIEPLIPGEEGGMGRHGEDNNLFVDAVRWLAGAEASWRDLPKEFSNWNSVFQRFRRWVKKGVWKRLFNALVEDPDFASCGRKGGDDEAIGRSRGGLSTMISIGVDAPVIPSVSS